MRPTASAMVGSNRRCKFRLHTAHKSLSLPSFSWKLFSNSSTFSAVFDNIDLRTNDTDALLHMWSQLEVGMNVDSNRERAAGSRVVAVRIFHWFTSKTNLKKLFSSSRCLTALWSLLILSSVTCRKPFTSSYLHSATWRLCESWSPTNVHLRRKLCEVYYSIRQTTVNW